MIQMLGVLGKRKRSSQSSPWSVAVELTDLVTECNGHRGVIESQNERGIRRLEHDVGADTLHAFRSLA